MNNHLVLDICGEESMPFEWGGQMSSFENVYNKPID
jgi:hypothetical protein